MGEIKRILDQLQRSFNGEAWHGPSLMEALSGVDAKKAIAKPISTSHSIWEIALHVAAWEGAVRTRLEEKYVALPEEGDWPEAADPSEEGWKNFLVKLDQVHNRLCETVGRLSDDQLKERIGQELDRETGGGVSIYATLHGVIHHNIYHAGQIALLKKM